MFPEQRRNVNARFLKGLTERKIWWRRVDSNHGPTDYETVALAT
jgi:hypothetical protein